MPGRVAGRANAGRDGGAAPPVWRAARHDARHARAGRPGAAGLAAGEPDCARQGGGAQEHDAAVRAVFCTSDGCGDGGVLGRGGGLSNTPSLYHQQTGNGR